MHAGTPPTSTLLSTSVLPRNNSPTLQDYENVVVPSLSITSSPPPIPSTSTEAAADVVSSPFAVLRQLMQEWYSGLAELLIGEAAAADVLGYADTPHLRACEWNSFSTLKGEGYRGTTDASCTRGRKDADGTMGLASSSFATDVEGGALLNSLELHSLNAPRDGTDDGSFSEATERLIARLTQLIPALQSDDTTLSLHSSSPPDSGLHASHLPSQQRQWQHQHPSQSISQRALAVLLPNEREEFWSNTNGPLSPSTSMSTAVPHTSSLVPNSGAATVSTQIAVTPMSITTQTPWWYAVVDALNTAMDSFDAVVNTVFSAYHRTTMCAPSTLHSLTSVSETHAMEAVATATTEEESCIMAGLLLNRNVRVRQGPAYTAATSPLLIVLDLDLTVLRQPLNSICFRAAQSMSAIELRALFVDADFFGGFCEAVTHRGHKLAICSLTEGAADQHECGLSVPEVVLALLSAVLPAMRSYLRSPKDIVCLPKSIAGPGKLFHLQLLQQRCNAREKSPAAGLVDGASGSGYGVSNGVSALDLSGAPSPDLSYSSRDAVDGSVCQNTAPARSPLHPPLLPRWLSTDVVLIDDDKENCRLAVTQGYHAAHCAESGLSASWFAARPDVQVLLGVAADEIPRRRLL